MSMNRLLIVSSFLVHMALAVVLATAGAIAYEACGSHAASIAWLLADFSDHLAISDVEVVALRAPLIVLRRRERMLVCVSRRRCPGTQEMTALLPVIIRPYVLAKIAAEDNPRGLCHCCCCHLSEFLSEQEV